MKYTRGDIFYVARTHTSGSEQQAGRPGIIVSSNKNNAFSSTVEVVYLTTQPKRDMPTHVFIRATGIPSTALCEQIHTVDKQRLTSYCGSCTEQEIRLIDTALCVSLGLETSRGVRFNRSGNDTELAKAKAQLDMLQNLYEDLLGRTVTSNKT